MKLLSSGLSVTMTNRPLLSSRLVCHYDNRHLFTGLSVTMTNRQVLFNRLVCYYDNSHLFTGFSLPWQTGSFFSAGSSVTMTNRKSIFIGQESNSCSSIVKILWSHLLHFLLQNSFFIFYFSKYFLILFSVTVQQKGLNTLLHKDSLDKYQSIKVMSHRVSFSIRRGLVWRP